MRVSQRKARTCCSLLFLLCIAHLHPSLSIQTQWPSWGSNLENWRFSDHACIDKKGLSGLIRTRPKWTLTTAGSVEATPTTCGANIFFVTASNLSPGSSSTFLKVTSAGRVIWTTSLGDIVPGLQTRTSPVFSKDCSTAYVAAWSLGKGSYLLSFNTQNGRNIRSTIIDDRIVSKPTASPTLHEGVLYMGISSSEESTTDCCVFQGKVLKVEADTGRIIWRKVMAARGYTGVGVWGSSPVVDTVRKQVCVGTGNNYRIPESVRQCIKQAGSNSKKQLECVARDNYVNAIVCLDMRTGDVKWAYSPLLNEREPESFDVWAGWQAPSQLLDKPSILGRVDADYAQAPILIPNRKDRSKDLLVGAPKSGRLIAVYAATGKVAWGPVDMHEGLKKPFHRNGHPQFGSCTNGELFCAAMFYYSKPGGTVACHEVKSGKRKWQVMVQPRGVYGPLTCTQELVFAPQMDQYGSLLVLDMSDGKLLGVFRTGATLFSGPAIVNATMYVGAGYAVNGGLPSNKAYAVPLPMKTGRGC